MSLPYFPFYVGDYLQDTGRLSTEAHGAYLLLILDYWTQGAPADDEALLATITKLPLEQWRKHEPLLKQFFDVTDGVWRHHRIDREIAQAEEKHMKRVLAGREGGKASGKTRSNASSVRKQTRSNATALVKQPEPELDSLPSGERAHAREAVSHETGNRPIPTDWTPSEADIAFGITLGHQRADIERLALKFRNHYLARGEKRVDWHAQFQAWLASEKPVMLAPSAPSPATTATVFVAEGTEAFEAWDAHNRAIKGVGLPCVDMRIDGRICRGWKLPTKWPPGHEPKENAA